MDLNMTCDNFKREFMEDEFQLHTTKPFRYESYDLGIDPDLPGTINKNFVDGISLTYQQLNVEKPLWTISADSGGCHGSHTPPMFVSVEYVSFLPVSDANGKTIAAACPSGSTCEGTFHREFS